MESTILGMLSGAFESSSLGWPGLAFQCLSSPIAGVDGECYDVTMKMSKIAGQGRVR